MAAVQEEAQEKEEPMSKRNWTESQRWAISARNGSLLVSAAAGSGKTAVLVQRVIERLTDLRGLATPTGC